MANIFKTQTDLSNCLIVDSLNLAFRWKHKGALSFVDEYLSTVASLAKSFKCGTVIIAADGGSSSYRRNLLPTYKANREALRADQSEADAEYFKLFLEEFFRVLEAYTERDSALVLKYHKVEADDIGAFIVKNRRKFNFNNITLVSSDKDWDLLIQDGVTRFSYVTRKETTLDNWHEHYDYAPEDHISIKCLTGDSGDNIPGVPQIAAGRAKTLLQEYGTTYDIIANLPLPGRYKYIQNLNNFGSDNLLLNYKLMDLLEFCEEAIGEANCEDIKQKVTQYVLSHAS